MVTVTLAFVAALLIPVLGPADQLRTALGGRSDTPPPRIERLDRLPPGVTEAYSRLRMPRATTEPMSTNGQPSSPPKAALRIHQFKIALDPSVVLAVGVNSETADSKRLGQPAPSVLRDASAFVEGVCPIGFLEMPAIGAPYGEWCFYDRDGKLHHWRREIDIVLYSHNFFGSIKDKTVRRYVTGYVYIRDQQTKYNKWVMAHEPCGYPDNYMCGDKPLLKGSIVCAYGPEPVGRWHVADEGHCPDDVNAIPLYIQPNGRLTYQTLLIPYYTSAYEFNRLSGRHYSNSGSGPSSHYPPSWDQAISELRQARNDLHQLVQDFRNFKEWQSDYLRLDEWKSEVTMNCRYERERDLKDCVFELDAIPAEVLDRLSVLTRTIANKTVIIQEMEVAYEVHPDSH